MIGPGCGVAVGLSCSGSRESFVIVETGREGGAFRMTTANKPDMKERLARYRQIKLSVIGRKTGQTISIPVWFVLEGDRLYLLPVRGSDTQWYRNVLKNPSIRIDARGAAAEFRVAPLKDAKSVKSVVEKFREKYGASDVKKYYAKFDVAVLAQPI